MILGRYNILEQLNGYVTGLNYPNEDGYPVKADVLPAGSEDSKAFLPNTGEYICEENIPAFFLKIRQNEDSYEKKSRFNNLKNFLERNFTQLKVYKVGKVKQNIFITGKSKSGINILLSTRALNIPQYYLADN